MRLTPHFDSGEFECRCGCHRGYVDPSFLTKLERARTHSSTAFVLTSAFRCEEHNRRVGGHPNSAHLRGMAVDIAAADNWHRAIILRAVFQVFDRVGIAQTFVHVDSDPALVAPRVWLYKTRHDDLEDS